jgi:hypothetical protein
MSLWIATIKAVAADGPTTQFRVLLESDDYGNVIPQAQEIAESMAPIGPKWVQFEAREAHKISLPCLLSTSRWTDTATGKRKR